MPICYVVPGFLSAAIYTPSILGPVLLWVNIPRIALGQFGALRLAPNGVDPGPPDGEVCTIGAGLEDYVETPAGVLRGQLASYGYTVTVVPYDWRKELITHGAALASKIRAEVSASDPCAIVCHSTGGLVARAAWANLGSTDQTNLVRRIVTLGTPHQGTYTPVMVFSKEDQLIRQLIFLNNALQMTPAARIPGYTRWQPGQIRNLCQTWVSLYQLFPALPAPSYDPDRAALYTASNWTNGAAPQQTWLDQARETWWPLMQSEDAMPPSWVLTTVSGSGWSTRYRLDDASKIGDPDEIAITTDGDGVVYRLSAEVPGSVIYRTSVAHQDQLPQLVTSGQVAEWVLAVRHPPDPAPPPSEVFAPVNPQYTGPPISNLGFPEATISACSSGGCLC